MVVYESRDGITKIQLNDPNRRNVLSPELVESLIQALGRFEQDKTARCAILTGTGAAFCSGGNPSRMLEPVYRALEATELMEFYRTGIQRLPLALQSLRKPVIAAINGPAIGAGCDLACFCDMRIASTNASFATSFVKLGLVPGDGGAWILPRIIGLSRANEMLLSGDPIDAQMALACGLVSRIVEPADLLDAASKLARSIARNPPDAVLMTKQLITASAQTNLPEALGMAASLQAAAHKTEDHVEAVKAFLEKRRPVFKGR